MTCPELRITDEQARAARVYRTATGTINGLGYFDEWGPFSILPVGASARIGAVLVARLPHLRHVVWPPRRKP